jgi:phospholipase C
MFDYVRQERWLLRPHGADTPGHTSLIRFLEHRFGVLEPNITPWRRTVTGDLTSAFKLQVTE